LLRRIGAAVLRAGEFKVGRQDFLLGLVAGDVPVWIGENTFAYWRHTRLILDAAPGRGAGMSLETPEGMRFLALSELLDDAEAATLDAAGEPRAARIDPLRSFPDTGPP
jgi:uncharacterized protein (DUF779 family)